MTDIYAGLGVFVFACTLALALARTAAGADESAERMFAEYLRERTRALQGFRSATIDARRIPAAEAGTRLSHQTWRSPSST
jgi:hypothetical protein